MRLWLAISGHSSDARLCSSACGIRLCSGGGATPCHLLLSAQVAGCLPLPAEHHRRRVTAWDDLSAQAVKSGTMQVGHGREYLRPGPFAASSSIEEL